MNHLNFGTLMDFVRRIIFLPLFLAFFSVIGHSLNAENILSDKIVEVSPFEENGKVGLKNTKGEIIIPASYEAIGWSDGSFSVVQNVTGFKWKGEWGLINLNNHKVTKAEYAELSPASASLIIARKKFPNSFRLLAGCINTSGKTVIPFLYDGIKISGLRAIIFQKTGTQLKYGLCDLDHRIIIPVTYENIYPLGSLRYAVVSDVDKTAIFGEDGTQITSFIIDSISSFKKNYAIVFQGNNQGVINRDGQILVEPIYREIIVNEDGHLQKRKWDNWLFLSNDHKVLEQVNADSVLPIFRNMYELKTATNSLLVNQDLKQIEHTNYSEIKPISESKAFVSKENKTGVIRSDGKELIPVIYRDITADNDFYRANGYTHNGWRWSVLDSTGKQITPKAYDFIGPFNGSFFPAKNKNFWGGIDRTGKEIIACVHDSIVNVHANYVVVKFKGSYGIIDTKEHWLITPQKNKIKLLENERYLEWSSSNKFIKNMKGEIIYFTSNPIEIRKDFILEFLPTGTIWQINSHGVVSNHETAPTNIQKIFPESEGYRAIKKDGQYGFVDNKLRLRIANRYENVKPFSDGLAAARILGKWGFINKEDNIAIQPVYDDVFSFENGTAVVKKNNMYGLIDKKGKVVLPVRYERLSLTEGKRILIQQNGLTGLADKTGRIILNAKYQSVKDLNNGFIIVSQNGKHGVVNVDGLSTIPMIYDWISTDQFRDRFIAMKKSEWEEGTL
jgi:hypothetical protein